MLDLLFNLLRRLFKGTDLEIMLSPQYEWRENIKSNIIYLTKRVVYILLGLAAAFAVITVILWGISPNASPAWTGFGDYINAKGEIERAKTLWDWMDLLVVPIVLAIGGFFLNLSARRSEQNIAEQRAKSERQRTIDQQRQKSLDEYFDKMGELLIDKHLRTSAEGEPRVVARARTLATLRSLGWGAMYDLEPDAERRGSILKFLHESGLIERDKSIVGLSGAELGYANLEEANLKQADLTECNLSSANLTKADLCKANLTEANLHEADLSETNLDHAILKQAYLRGAVLRGCILTEADLTRALLMEADLRRCHLESAMLRNTNLSHVNLVGASLCGADLHGADLTGSKVEGIPQEEYSRQFLKGMSKEHIQWLTKQLRVDLRGATYDESTKWPNASFDPQAYGAMKKARSDSAG